MSEIIGKIIALLGKITPEKIYSLAGPVGAPMPSAFALGMNMYDYMLKVYPAHPWAAAIAAFGGVAGIESTGASSAILVSKAYVSRDKNTALAALAVLVAYIGFVAAGIYTGKDSAVMVVSVGITLLWYIVQALWSGRSEAKTKAETEQDTKKLDLKLQKEVTAQKRAEARAAKASSGRQAPFTERSVNAPDPEKEYRYDPDVLARAVEIMAKYRAKTGQEISGNGLAKALGMANQTGQVYKAKVLEDRKKEVTK